MLPKEANIAGLAMAVAIVATLICVSYWNDASSLQRGPFGIPLHAQTAS